MTEHFGDWVPTVVQRAFAGEGRDSPDRHIITSIGPDGAWTLCGRWISLRRLRILSRNREAHTTQVREELEHVESWPFTDCHARCAEKHLYEKRHYRIGSGPWRWLWQPPAPVAPVVTLDEAKKRLAALEAVPEAPHLPWWRRWLGRAVHIKAA